MVNSTTPRFGPRCPPVTDTFSMRNALIAAASFVNSSRDNPCRSRGLRIRARTSAETEAPPESSRSRSSSGVTRSDAADATPTCGRTRSVSTRCCSPGRALLVALVMRSLLPRWSVLRSIATNLVARRRDWPPRVHHSRRWRSHPRSVASQAISAQTTCARSGTFGQRIELRGRRNVVTIAGTDNRPGLDGAIQHPVKRDKGPRASRFPNRSCVAMRTAEPDFFDAVGLGSRPPGERTVGTVDGARVPPARHWPRRPDSVDASQMTHPFLRRPAPRGRA